ncbi:hypothetical protein F66182_3294 [Fusarium sp. NRRL 66182]|nr:hypothetical protein F66182_3294 [Fusarium sp. NRRL 66182]
MAGVGDETTCWASSGERMINFASEDTSRKRIKTTKAEFHMEIVADILAGITTVAGISQALECVLEGFSKVVLQSKEDVQDKSFWSFLNVFTWDDVTQDVKGSIRIIWYRVSGEMIEYTINKATVSEISLALEFQQSQFTFVELLWDSSKAELIKFLTEYSNKSIRDPIDGEITP